MTEDIRVKDLSNELGVSGKDVLQALRDIGVTANTFTSKVTDEEADQIRARFKAGKSTEVIRKEIQPGVIVRRRRRPRKGEPELHDDAPESLAEEAAPEAPEAAPAEVAETAPEQAPEPEQTAEPEPVAEPVARVVRPVGQDVPAEEPVAEEAAPEPAPAEVSEEPAVAESAPESASADEAPAAQFASPVEEQPDEPGKVAEAAPVEPAAEAPAEEAKADAPAAPAESPVSGDAAGGKESEEPKKKKRKKKDSAASPQVKVIHRPEASEVAARPAPAPRRQAGPGGPRPGGPGGPRPGGPRPGGPGGPRPGGPRPGGPGGPGRPAPGAPGAPAAADGRKRRKKDRRMVEFGPQSAEDNRRRAGALQAKKAKAAEFADSGRAKPNRRKRPRNLQEEIQQATEAMTIPTKAAKRKLRMEEFIRVSDMAHQMGIKAPLVIKALMNMGVLSTINQSLDFDTATLIAGEFGWEVERVGFSEDVFILPSEADKPEDLKPRPPVVTIMGHVDHGKTSLLDAIRKSKVDITSGEAGGITQHIGAYHVQTSRGEIVFLDTPGHEAFTAMRARGAQVTDLVILVVAADDGVMDQTREAINHSKAAGVPIVVAVNKMDKEDADPDRVKRELGELGLLPEDWGGETIYAHVSAKQETGIDELLELVLLQAEVLELKANPDKAARGHIVEAKLDKGRGPVGTVLIQEGTLRQGDAFVCGLFSGRVRAMFNDQGKSVKEAGPAFPVEVQGFEGVPDAGDEFVCVEDERLARRISDERQTKSREKQLARDSKLTLETFLSKKKTDEEQQTLNLILKSDVQGSLEAITDALHKLSTDLVKVEVKHGGAGAITESDILLASASEAIIIGFNVRPTLKVKELAEQEGVDIRFYDIIYKLVNEVKDAMSGLLAPVVREVYLGQAEVRETFSVPKIGIIAGCGVTDGKLKRNSGVRLLRDGVVIYTGTISSLKRFKDDAKEVLKGYECGIGLENFNDIKVGDTIEAFEEVEEQQTL